MPTVTLKRPSFAPDPLSAVLFDFDGVLAMTIEDNFKVWRKVLGQVGVTLDRTEYMLLEGRRATEMLKVILGKAGVKTASIDELIDHKRREYEASNEFRLYEGVPEVLRALKAARIKLGLVSGGSKARIIATFPPDLMKLFDAVVCGEDAHESKPSPIPYRTAATSMGVPFAECLVVENAPLGIQAARAAGMTCVAITSTLEEKYLVEAHAIVATMLEFGRAFGELTQAGL